MEELGKLKDGAAARAALVPLVDAYRDWIKAESDKIAGLDARRQDIAKQLIANASAAADRIADGILILETQSDTLEASASPIEPSAGRQGRGGQTMLRSGGLFSSLSSSSTCEASLLRPIPIGPSRTFCSFRLAAARPKHIWASPRSRWCYDDYAIPACSGRASP